MAITDFLGKIFGGGQSQPMNDQTKMAMLVARNPNLGNFLLKQQERQDLLNEQKRMSTMAPYIYGDPGAQGAPGSGVYDTTVPDEVRLREMNKRMLQTGLNRFIDQWSTNQTDMQKSVMDAYKANQKAPTSWEEYIRTLPPGEQPTGPGYDAFLKNKKSGINIDMGNKQVPLDKLPFLYDKNTGETAPPGIKYEDLGNYEYRPKKSREEAATAAMFKVAMSTIKPIRSMIYNTDQGKGIDRKSLFGLSVLEAGKNSVIPGAELATKWFASPKAKELQNQFEQGISAILRSETGAAIANQEFANAARRFMPSYNDPDEVIDAKLQAYETFIKTASELLTPFGGKLPKDQAVALANQLAEEATRNIPQGGNQTVQVNTKQPPPQGSSGFADDGLPIYLD